MLMETDRNDKHEFNGGNMIKESKNSAKIFTDVLADYEDLKYIFIYGFYWDDQITKIMFSKGSQTIRQLTNILAKPVYGACVNMSWYESTNGKAKQSARKLIWNNHYRLNESPWFAVLYRCYGVYDQNADYKINQCERDSYTECQANNSLCHYRGVCWINEEERIFAELVENGIERKAQEWKDSIIFAQIRRNYRDVLEKREGKWRLKQNLWTKEVVVQNGILKDSVRYQAFVEWIQFMSMFAPLAVIGSHFLNNLGYPAATPYFFIRNLPMDFGLEQEYMYRCLYAMAQGLEIEYENERYIPLKMEYENKGLTGLKERLYLQAIRAESGETERIWLGGGYYVIPGKKQEIRGQDREENLDGENQKTQYITFTIDFYYREDTEYLVRRRREGWQEEMVSDKIRHEIRIRHFESPYYPGITEWKTDRVIYRVKEEDEDGFLSFISSFGDFASLVSREGPLLPGAGEKSCEKEERRRRKVQEYQSLLSAYYSERIHKKVSRPLPPRKAELEWLSFILRMYPNFCRLFLDEEEIKLLEKRVNQEVGIQLWYFAERIPFRSRWKDLERRMVDKYRRILEAIKSQGVLYYEYHERQVHLLPYALEYDVTRHLASADTVQPPFDIMCYDMTEKRNVRILYREIQTKTVKAKDEYNFSELDKLYHIMAYGLRCAVMESQKIDGEISDFLQLIWKVDRRGGDNYNRCIRKKLNKASGYQKEYDRLRTLCDRHSDAEGSVFAESVFQYWTKEPEEDNMQWKYRTLLLRCFTDGYQRLHSVKTNGRMQRCLDSFSKEEIWRLINGRSLGEIVNEIAFENERLKNAKITFWMKNGEEDKIDQIYRLFGNFLCAGEMKDGGKIFFTVTYEKFYYRKIHMALMAAAEWIEKIEPAETAEIIKSRLKNREEGKK